MNIIQVGWSTPEGTEPIEYLVNMTSGQQAQLESKLQEAVSKGRITEYWMADAIILPFKTFMRTAR